MMKRAMRKGGGSHCDRFEAFSFSFCGSKGKVKKLDVFDIHMRCPFAYI
jgi:hypothetical protein